MLSENRVTYVSYLCNYHPLKDKPYKVRITVGGHKLDYHNDAS